MWKSSNLTFLAVFICISIIFLSHVPSSQSLPQGSSLPIPSRIMSTICTRNQDCSSKFNSTDCRNGRFCQCEKGFLEDLDTCLPVILDLVTECKLNAQCILGTLGNLSRCNEETKRCECYDVAGHGKNSTAHGSHTCYYRLALGDYCEINEQCRASIIPEQDVRCDVPSRACVCASGKTCENVKGGGMGVGESLPKFVALVMIAFVAVKIVS